MANTTNYNLPYPDDYTQIADVPAAVKDLAEATDAALGDKQDTSNLVTSIDSNSTDTEYPSAKCVYDLVGDLESILETLDVRNGGGINVN